MQTVASVGAILFLGHSIALLLRSPNRNGFSMFLLYFGLGALLVALLGGCTIRSVSDPFGSTSRRQIEADAQVEIARSQERAAIAVAEAEAGAIIAKHSVWASILPTALVIIGIVVLAGLYLNWRGRHTLVALQNGYSPPQAPALPTLAQFPGLALPRPSSPPQAPTLADLRRLAANQGYSLIVDGNYALLMDGDQVKGRRLLEG